MNAAEQLGELAKEVIATAVVAAGKAKTHLEFKLELDRKIAEEQIALKFADPKIPEYMLNAKVELKFNADYQTEITMRHAFKIAEIACAYASDKLSIEKRLVELETARTYIQK